MESSLHDVMHSFHYGLFLEKALMLATYYHKGQVDISGQPYIMHLLSVASRVETVRQKTIAVLHDILEDTDIPEHILSVYFRSDIVDGVVALTRRGGVYYDDYIDGIMNHYDPDVVLIKIADLRHNCDPIRLGILKDHDVTRMNKYMKALGKLEQTLRD